LRKRFDKKKKPIGWRTHSWICSRERRRIARFLPFIYSHRYRKQKPSGLILDPFLPSQAQMTPKNVTNVEALNDLVLGSIGQSIPPSEIVNHAVRYFGTWAGSDKLMMTAQYSAKLLIPLLELRAALQFKNHSRDKPISPTAKGLETFAESLGSARRVSGLWGILSMIRWISSIERSEPKSRTLQSIERIQALSMLTFYSLENLSFFTSPSAPLLTKYFSSSSSSSNNNNNNNNNNNMTSKASLWSIRALALYTLLQLVHLRADWKELKRKERVLEKSAVGESTDVDLMELKKQKMAISVCAIENLAYLPLTIHWSFTGGIFKSEFPVNLLSLIAALASFRAGWDATALPR